MQTNNVIGRKQQQLRSILNAVYFEQARTPHPIIDSLYKENMLVRTQDTEGQKKNIALEQKERKEQKEHLTPPPELPQNEISGISASGNTWQYIVNIWTNLRKLIESFLVWANKGINLNTVLLIALIFIVKK